MSSNIPQVLANGIDATSRGDYAGALTVLAAVYQAVPPEKYPKGLSAYGLCLSRVEHRNKAGAELCEKAILLQVYDAQHWVNLIRLYLGVKNRRKAVEVLERGLKRLPYDADLLRVRNEIGYRQAPYFRFLSRRNPINKLFSRSAVSLKRNTRPILLALGGVAYAALLAGVFTYIFN